MLTAETSMNAVRVPNDMSETQWRFVHSEFLALSVAAAFARSCIYDSQANESDRESLRKDLKLRLSGYAAKYAVPVDDDQHNKHIIELASQMTQAFGNVLHEKTLRIGTAQKALNLYLKYLWCVGVVAEPPHCPIDAIVLQRAAKLEPPIYWTKIKNIGEYMRCIEAVRLVAGDKSLAQWECEAWNG